jgi:hypothetical protein
MARCFGVPALYNNGSFPLKDARFGESYDGQGRPQTLLQTGTDEQRRAKGYLTMLDPIPTLGDLTTRKRSASF